LTYLLEPGGGDWSDAIADGLRAIFEIVVIITVGPSVVVFVGVMLTGLVWRLVAKRKPSWWWFVSIGVGLAMAAFVAMIVTLYAGMVR
jgi:hypothetical protein